ncbi:MAG: tRNA 2-thiouridine(34) synthase MnmA [Planctomycetes bacterium]|nr:tRNA 2-thiouridine(34) synthase MnmA [Planctomycetota bacterium]
MKLLPPSFSLGWSPTQDVSRQIAVLMSGGVDSSTTAHILKEDGWDVLGITMRIPVSCELSTRGCCGVDAALVCKELGVAHYFVDVAEPFNELIIGRFRQSYANGQTPNPCIDCNSLLKFSLLWDFLHEEFGIKYLATGHYARVIKNDGEVRLGRAKDRTKDQSYFLYGISLERLGGLVLPLGGFAKDEIRSIASDLGLSVADKAESMELCFAGEGDYRVALTEDEAEREGDLMDMQGNKISSHKGISNYTIGQRRGVGFAGGKPLYVGRIDAKNNTVALGTREEVSFNTVKAEQVNVLIGKRFVAGEKLFGKIRSYNDPHACKVVEADENVMTVEFEQVQFAPCPGQRLVLYDGDDNIVAGGVIVSAY